MLAELVHNRGELRRHVHRQGTSTHAPIARRWLGELTRAACRPRTWVGPGMTLGEMSRSTASPLRPCIAVEPTTFAGFVAMPGHII
jgi:hypothetical protein